MLQPVFQNHFTEKKNVPLGHYSVFSCVILLYFFFFEIGNFLEKDVFFVLKCLLGLKGFVNCFEKRNFRFDLKMGLGKINIRG